MRWMNAEELSQHYTDNEFRARFADLFALRLLLRGGILPPQYAYPKLLGEAIVLSQKGNEWSKKVLKQIGESDEHIARVKLALFLEFAHQDLLIDLDNTDTAALARFISSEVKSGTIRYPWIFGRLLYDRFFEMFPNQTMSLTQEETMKLLDGTPQGVFQIGKKLVGPFGVLTSTEVRRLYPVDDAPLWHCSDISCSALHPVTLSKGQEASEQLIRRAISSIRKQGKPSEWWGLFMDILLEQESYYDDMSAVSLPWLLGNGFSERERQLIAIELLSRRSKDLRTQLLESGFAQTFVQGSAGQVVERFNSSECFQFLLLSSNEDIVRATETLIDRETIHIPFTEVRTPIVSASAPTWLQIKSECSRNGVRFVPRSRNIPVARLKKLINAIYDTSDLSKLLEWRLRKVEGRTVHERLDRLLYTEDPAAIVRDLIMTDPAYLGRAFSTLRYGQFGLPTTEFEEEQTVRKLLWKIGFNIETHPPHNALFWERLEKLIGAASSLLPYSETDRENIRSAGVNFFVSLEEILDQSLAFSTWALLADHYAKTRFVYNLDAARQFMANRLNTVEDITGVHFDPLGKNTLYPLIRGFSILAKLLEQVCVQGEDDFLRPKKEMPDFSYQSDLELFPFSHTLMILDVADSDKVRIIELLKSVTQKLEAADVCNVRNRIEHRRSDFPHQTEIESVYKAVSDAATDLELSGILPLIWLTDGVSSDRFGRGKRFFRDFRGRTIGLDQPLHYPSSRMPSFNKTQVIMPWVRIAESSELLRFEYQEGSAFVDVWEGYPRRRLRTNSDANEDNLDSG